MGTMPPACPARAPVGPADRASGSPGLRSARPDALAGRIGPSRRSAWSPGPPASAPGTEPDRLARGLPELTGRRASRRGANSGRLAGRPAPAGDWGVTTRRRRSSAACRIATGLAARASSGERAEAAGLAGWLAPAAVPEAARDRSPCPAGGTADGKSAAASPAAWLGEEAGRPPGRGGTGPASGVPASGGPSLGRRRTRPAPGSRRPSGRWCGAGPAAPGRDGRSGAACTPGRPSGSA
jgi:hypothetical protein